MTEGKVVLYNIKYFPGWHWKT